MMIKEEDFPSLILRTSLVILFLATAISFLLFSKDQTIGLFSGGAVAVLNFIWQRRTLSKLLTGQSSSAAVTTFFRFLFRLGVNGLILYLILKSGVASVFGLLVGLSLIVIVIIILTAYQLFHQDKGD